MKIVSNIAVILVFLAATAPTAFADEKEHRLANPWMNIHCALSGETTRAMPQKDAVHDRSEIQWMVDAPWGIWSDSVDFELERNSSRAIMKWNGRSIEARRLYPFRPFRIRAKTTEQDVTWNWRFRFLFYVFSRISDRYISRVEAQVWASKKSVKDPRVDVSFYGGSNCYVFRTCEAGAMPTKCPTKNLCLNEKRQCGIVR